MSAHASTATAENRTIAVTFEINEGARVFVERIEIAGNVRTSEEVIRREFRMVEGDAFNTAKLRRSRQRLNNLNFFEKVDIEQVPGSVPDKTVIKVDVEEKIHRFPCHSASVSHRPPVLSRNFQSASATFWARARI